MSEAQTPEQSATEQAGEIRIVVIGKPQTAGSKNAFVIPGTNRASVSDDNKKSRGWKNQVAEKAVDAMAGRELLLGPLEVTMTFFRQRPQGHFGTGKNEQTVKASSPKHPTTKPDVLKQARAAEDALTSIVYRDDAQIVDEHLYKRFGVPERLEIVVRRMD